MIRNTSLFIVCLAVMAGCSTEVDLNAPYVKTTVVYGLLDPVADTQWVKINKTFLGDGNNLDYATIRDSSEYDFSDFEHIRVIRMTEEGEVQETYDLDSLTIHNKEVNGIFYAPEQTVYYFPTPSGLDQAFWYKLDIKFNDGRQVSSEPQPLVQPSLISTTPSQNASATLILGQQNTNGIQYKTPQFKIIPTSSAPFYELTMRFNYTERLYADEEQTVQISEEEKFIDFFIGSYGEDDINTAGNILCDISGEAFFSFLGNSLEKSPFISRQIGFFDGDDTRCFDFIVSMGGEELYTYYQVNSPVTGIIQERPSYSNINNGLGLFSSRSTLSVTDVLLVNSTGAPNPGNLYCLVNSPYTLGLNFCDPNPSSDYPCE